MPAGNDPPDPGLPQTVFDALHPMGYDATKKAFKQAQTYYYLFGEKKSGGSYDQAAWFYGTTAEGGSNPLGKIPQITYDVIHDGTYNTSNATVTYQGGSYRFRFTRDPQTGDYLAEAHTI